MLHEMAVSAAVGESGQRLGALPDREVGQDHRVDVRGRDLRVKARAGGAPDEAGRGVGQRVDPIQRFAELAALRRLDGGGEAGDVELGEVEAAHLRVQVLRESR